MEWRSGQALRGKAHRDAACGNAANRRLKMPMARRRIASDFSVLTWFLLPHGKCGVLMNPESSADASPQAQEISATRLIKKRIYFFVVLPIVVAGLALFAAPPAYSRFALNVVSLGVTVNCLADTVLAFRYGEVEGVTCSVIRRSSAPRKFYCLAALIASLSFALLIFLILSVLKNVSHPVG